MTTNASPGDWGPCPPGELTRLASWLRFRRRLWTLAAVGGVVLGVAGGSAVTYWAVTSDSGDPARHFRRLPRANKAIPTVGNSGTNPTVSRAPGGNEPGKK